MGKKTNNTSFGNGNDQDLYGSWGGNSAYISEHKFKEQHMKKFAARQLQLRNKQEQAEKYRNFPNGPKKKGLLAIIPKTEPVVPRKPDYATGSMTEEDVAEMVKGKEVLTLKQIEDFFESKIKQKVCFEGVPVTVLEVFPRSVGVAVQFSITKTEIGQLISNDSSTRKNKEQVYCTVNIEGSGPVKLFGKIQGSIHEKFKILFS